MSIDANQSQIGHAIQVQLVPLYLNIDGNVLGWSKYDKVC